MGPRGRAKGSSAETRAEPWLPLPDDHNVAAKREDPSFILILHRRLLALRRAPPALQTGSSTPVPATGDGLSYTREANGSRYLVALNLGHDPLTMAPDTGPSTRGRLVFSTHLDREREKLEGELRLRPDEGVIFRLDA